MNRGLRRLRRAIVRRVVPQRYLFIASTGRSGTTTIARLLASHPRIACRHEPRERLIRLSTELEHGALDREAARAELARLYPRRGNHPGRLYGESDHRLFNLVGILAGLHPTARFVWLVRDGRAVVASTLARGWYGGEYATGEWGRHRLRGDACGDVPAAEWSALSIFEKNCWYWSYVNRALERGLAGLPPDRWRRVRLEELEAATPRLFEFLGVAPLPRRVPHANPSERAVVPPRDWDAAEREAFERRCGDLMDRWYEGWRTSW